MVNSLSLKTKVYTLRTEEENQTGQTKEETGIGKEDLRAGTVDLNLDPSTKKTIRGVSYVAKRDIGRENVLTEGQINLPTLLQNRNNH